MMVPVGLSRQLTTLLESEYRQGVARATYRSRTSARSAGQRSAMVAAINYAIDKWALPGQRLIIVTSEGRIIGAQRNEIQVVRNFMGQSDNADHPKRKIRSL